MIKTGARDGKFQGSQTQKSGNLWNTIDTDAAKSLQLCLTLCNPIDGLLPGSSVSGILQARTLEWVAISFSNAWKWKVKVKLLSHVQLLVTPWTAAYQAPPSMGFSRQEYWSGVPLPSPQLDIDARISLWPLSFIQLVCMIASLLLYWQVLIYPSWVTWSLSLGLCMGQPYIFSSWQQMTWLTKADDLIDKSQMSSFIWTFQVMLGKQLKGLVKIIFHLGTHCLGQTS